MKIGLTGFIKVIIGVMFTTNAYAVTFSFQENGSNLDLGPTSTFTEGGFSLTASGFLTSGGPTDLFAKNAADVGGSSEVGLGTTSDPTGDHEITTANFIQLTLPTTPPSHFQLVLLASVQGGEQAQVYFTTTSGTLTGATLIGTVTNADGSVTVPVGDQTGFIDITAGSKNVLLSAAVVNGVPDGGSTVSLFGIALAGIGLLQRTLRPEQSIGFV
jgi:VPDSG-CTERM motif